MTDPMSTDRGASSLASNNPFRNRMTETATSPGLAPIKPVSTNPFLDSSELAANGRLPPTGTNGVKQTSEPDQTLDIFVGSEQHPQLDLLSS